VNPRRVRGESRWTSWVRGDVSDYLKQMALNIEVREHRTDELRTLVALTARSFWDDPLYNFFTPDLLSQHKTTGLFHSLLLDAAAYGLVWTARSGDEYVGVAAWLPPGVTIPARGLRAMKQVFRVALVPVATGD
jgi:hypothetical protein